MSPSSWRDELQHHAGGSYLASDTLAYGGHQVEEHLGDPNMLPTIVVAFIIISGIIPYAMYKLRQLHLAGIGTSPAYAVALLLSGTVYWAVLLMQLVALVRGLWAVYPGLLRLLWMLLSSTGHALQIYAYSKFLWMWVGYSRGVGELTTPRVAVSRLDSLLVTGLVAVVGANFIAQVVIAALFYDVAEEEGDVHSGLVLKESGELLDFAVECLWFAVTLRLICAIPQLPPHSLGRATRLELQQYTQLGATGRRMCLAHAFIFVGQIVALVFFGHTNGEAAAYALQMVWFLLQISYQTDVMNKVYENYMLSLIAVEGTVEAGKIAASQGASFSQSGGDEVVGDARAARRRWLNMQDDTCGMQQAIGAAAYFLFLVAAMATAIAVGALIVSLHHSKTA